MKKKALLVSLLSTALLLSACSGDGNTDTSTGEPTTTTTEPGPSPVVDDDYAIIVTCPAGVTYELNKTRAKFNEEVVLTITSVAAGFSIKDVRANGVTLTAEGSTYKFTIPNRSATIIIRVSVEGDVVTDGDFAVAFNEVEEDVFEATAAIPAASAAYSKFNVVISGSTNLRTTDLDYSTSFGDVSAITGSSNIYAFEIANGATYKFRYDTNKNESPLSVQRLSVQALPNSPSALASILVDGYAIYSEPAMFINDYIGATYDVLDRRTSDAFHHNFTYTKYADNKTLAVISDVDEPDRPDMYTYRAFDEVNNTYTVVDSYPLKVGEVTANDYRFREGYNGYGAYSAKYDIIEEDDYGHRYAKQDWKVAAEMNCSAHQPAYLLEHDIWYGYRSSELTSVAIVSEATANGFTTAVDSYQEVTDNGATVYDIDFNFDARGAVKAMLFKQVSYTDAQWDYTAHAPKTGQIGQTKRRINATYTYGEATGTCPFDPSPYFITSIDTYKYVNPKLASYATNEDSYLGFEDYLYIQDNEGVKPTAVTVSFTPSTALDLWEYGPVTSSNENVIAKQATDVYYQMSPINEGDAVVTFSNHVATPSIKGASKDVNVHVIATEAIRSFYFDQTWDPGYAQHETWNTAIVYANGQYKFRVNSSPSAAPVIYNAVSSDPSLLTITSAANSRDLIIDTTGANGITENKLVHITFESARYDTSFGPTVFDIYIMPAQASPVGTWRHLSPEYPETYMYFTETAYGTSGYFQGSVVDHVIIDDQDLGTNTFNFAYRYNGAYIEAFVYALDIQYNPGGGTIPSADSVTIQFFYEPSTGHYGLFLAEVYIEDEVEYYYPWFGSVDETYTIIEGGDPFAKVS